MKNFIDDDEITDVRRQQQHGLGVGGTSQYFQSPSDETTFYFNSSSPARPKHKKVAEDIDKAVIPCFPLEGISVHYPLFLECVPWLDKMYASNQKQCQYMKTIFYDLAYGKCPYGTYFSRGYLCSKLKKREFMYQLSNRPKSIEVVACELVELLWKILYHGNYSAMKLTTAASVPAAPAAAAKPSRELAAATAATSEAAAAAAATTAAAAAAAAASSAGVPATITWKNIRKQSVKQFLLSEFVGRMKVRWGISLARVKLLYNIINISIFFKVFDSVDIVFEQAVADNRVNEYSIKSIKGLTFTDGHFHLDCEVILIASSPPTLQTRSGP
jgi:hypothetical protein